MSISRKDKFKAHYFGQMTPKELSEFEEQKGKDPALQLAYKEYSMLQDAFLAEEYVRNCSDTGPISAADQEDLYLYVEGNITNEDRIAAIKARLKTDGAYREEYEMMKEIAMMDVEEDTTTETLSPTLASAKPNSPPKAKQAKVRRLRPRIYRQLGIAASVLVLLVAGWWVISKVSNTGNYEQALATLIKSEGREVKAFSDALLQRQRGSLGGSHEKFDSLREMSLTAIIDDELNKGEELLIKMNTSFPEEWAEDVDMQELYIMLLMGVNGTTSEKTDRALALISAFKQNMSERSIDENVKQREYLLPMSYNEALLLALKQETKNNAILLLRASLSNENLKSEDEKRMIDLMDLIK